MRHAHTPRRGERRSHANDIRALLPTTTDSTTIIIEHRGGFDYFRTDPDRRAGETNRRYRRSVTLRAEIYLSVGSARRGGAP